MGKCPSIFVSLEVLKRLKYTLGCIVDCCYEVQVQTRVGMKLSHVCVVESYNNIGDHNEQIRNLFLLIFTPGPTVHCFQRQAITLLFSFYVLLYLGCNTKCLGKWVCLGSVLFQVRASSYSNVHQRGFI